MVNIFFGFWKNFSFIILTLVFLYCYASLPDSIAYIHNKQGYPIKFIDKQQFFYWTAGTLFFFNLLMASLKNSLLKIDYSKFIAKSQWANKPIALKALLKGWFDAFVAIINTFLVFVILGINNVNANNKQKLDFNYNWMLLVAAILIMILIFSLPYRLLFTNPGKNEDEYGN